MLRRLSMILHTWNKYQPCNVIEFFLKSFIMSSIQHLKIFVSGFCLAILLLSCNSNSKDQQTSDSSVSNDRSHHDSLQLSDNEVREEAPDATTKSGQGYALPRHGAESSQSPINIISDKSEKITTQQYSFVFHSDFNAAENLGHTIQVDFKPGSTCTVNGKDYTSKQFHFHTPSEHLIDGETFPLEMHIVNTLNDSSNQGKPSYFVISVLFRMGAENKFIDEFLNKIPNEERGKNNLQTGEVKLDDLLSQFTANDIKSYYVYKGSLTTPPFTEGVQWILLKHVIEASEEQIAKIEKMEGNNARHVQAINDRKVYNQ